MKYATARQIASRLYCRFNIK